MKEQLITFETAKLAKEKGFDIPCLSFYYTEEFNTNEIKTTRKLREVHDKKYLAPTQSLLQKWLRDMHNIHITIMYFSGNNDLTLGDNYQPMIDIMKPKHTAILHDYGDFITYELALEKGLQEALKLIK